MAERQGSAVACGADVDHDFSLLKVDNCAAYLLPFLRHDSHVLDLGCGPGSITADFAKRCPAGRVVGLDIDAAVIEVAEQIYGIGDDNSAQRSVPKFLVGDAAKDLPFADSTFDIVHGHQFAHLVSNVAAETKEWRRVLKPGGVLALRVMWFQGIMPCPPDREAFGYLAAAMDGMFHAAGGDACVLQRDFVGIAQAAGFTTAEVFMDAFDMRAKKVQKAWSRFLLSDGMVGEWRKQGSVTEEQIRKITDAVNAVVHAKNGFFFVPCLAAICRA